MSNKIIVRHISKVQPVDCPCGKSTRILTGKDNPTVSVHFTETKDAQSHYHKKTAEIYYILEGKGRMHAGTESIDLEPGLLIHIPAGIRHRVVGNIKTLVIATPAFDNDDEFFD
ncbi:cupin domain-containing protein [candidate division KSB1 bacterium]|nr:cupin domain-containing protein [candidate division KSB1 bacterium]